MMMTFGYEKAGRQGGYKIGHGSETKTSEPLPKSLYWIDRAGDKWAGGGVKPRPSITNQML
jgi:hypothetical protein